MRTITLALCLAASGCAANLTPEQRAALLQYSLQQQQMQQQQNEAWYRDASRAFNTPAPAVSPSVNCTSQKMGNTTYMNCR